MRDVKLHVGACPNPETDVVRAELARFRARVAVTWRLRYLQAVGAFAAIALVIGLTISLGVPIHRHVHDDLAPIVYGTLFVLLASAALAIAYLMVRAGRRFHRTARRNLLLALGRCPSCGFTIGGHVAGAVDGCVTCGECGAAWLAERVAPVTIDEADGWGVARLRTRIRGASQHAFLRRDARGRRVAPLAGPRLSRAVAREAGSRVAYSFLATLVAAVVAIGTLICTVTVAILIGTAVVGAVVESVAAPWAEGLAVLVTVILLLPLVAIVPAALASRALGHLRSNAVLHSNRCPCCESTLPPSGGAPIVVCTGCAAAWRAPRLRSQAEEPLC